ncbi:MAG: hypothetical protein WA879_10215 [Candidatus Acidiferrales bacterium]
MNDAAFLRELAARVPHFPRHVPGGGADIVFLAAEAVDDLRRIANLLPAIARNGAVWVIYPKGQKHIRETDVMQAGKAAGFTDNKVARFSATHTALRFCIPVSQR